MVVDHIQTLQNKVPWILEAELQVDSHRIFDRSNVFGLMTPSVFLLASYQTSLSRLPMNYYYFLIS